MILSELITSFGDTPYQLPPDDNKLIIYRAGEDCRQNQPGISLPMPGWWLYTNYANEHDDFPLSNADYKHYTATLVQDETGADYYQIQFDTQSTFNRVMEAAQAVASDPELPVLAIGFTKPEWRAVTELADYQALLPGVIE